MREPCLQEKAEPRRLHVREPTVCCVSCTSNLNPQRSLISPRMPVVYLRDSETQSVLRYERPGSITLRQLQSELTDVSAVVDSDDRGAAVSRGMVLVNPSDVLCDGRTYVVRRDRRFVAFAAAAKSSCVAPGTAGVGVTFTSTVTETLYAMHAGGRDSTGGDRLSDDAAGGPASFVLATPGREEEASLRTAGEGIIPRGDPHSSAASSWHAVLPEHGTTVDGAPTCANTGSEAPAAQPCSSRMSREQLVRLHTNGSQRADAAKRRREETAALLGAYREAGRRVHALLKEGSC